MPSFIADRMVERLARWLRLLGEDVDCPAPSPEGFHEAARAGRVVITRDTRLARSLEQAGLQVLFITHNHIADQLRQTDQAFPLTMTAPLSRCSRCNTPLVFMDPKEAGDALWPHVGRTQRRVGNCPACGRYYWNASHVRRMAAFLTRALGRSAALDEQT